MATATIPNVGDMVIIQPGNNPSMNGLHIVTAVLPNLQYQVTPYDNPRAPHSQPVPQSRILYVYRAD